MTEYNGGSLKAEHLCVMVHGLWGKPAHLGTVAKTLRNQFSEDELHLLVAESNSGYFTYDGIETGGERVCQEVEDALAAKQRDGGRITRLSVIGYSLGGLVARYAVGLLQAKGILDTLECHNFVAFASPFLGTRSPRKGVLDHLFNVIGANTLSVSGRQLFGIDSFRDTGRPLVAVLADPDSIFIAGLARFRRRTLYANIVNDRTAVHYTTAISRTDPYTAIVASGGELADLPLQYVPGYGDIVIANGGPVEAGTSSTEEAAAGESANGSSHSKAAVPRRPRGWKAVRIVVTNPLSPQSKAILSDLAPGVAIVALLPLGLVLYMANSVYQTVQSRKRLQLHEGEGGVRKRYHGVPLWIDSLGETVEEAYEHINNAHEQEFMTEADEEAVLGSGDDGEETEQGEDDDLGTDEDDKGCKARLLGKRSGAENGDVENGGVSSRLRQKLKTKSQSSGQRHHHHLHNHAPYLALKKEQFDMIESLDSLGWRKYPVWIHKVRHSHAAMIVRWETPRFSEGHTVLKHFVTEEFLI